MSTTEQNLIDHHLFLERYGINAAFYHNLNENHPEYAKGRQLVSLLESCSKGFINNHEIEVALHNCAYSHTMAKYVQADSVFKATKNVFGNEVKLSAWVRIDTQVKSTDDFSLDLMQILFDDFELEINDQKYKIVDFCFFEDIQAFNEQFYAHLKEMAVISVKDLIKADEEMIFAINTDVYCTSTDGCHI